MRDARFIQTDLAPKVHAIQSLRSAIAIGLIVFGGLVTILWSAFLAWAVARLLLILW